MSDGTTTPSAYCRKCVRPMRHVRGVMHGEAAKVHHYQCDGCEAMIAVSLEKIDWLGVETKEPPFQIYDTDPTEEAVWNELASFPKPPGENG